MSVMLLDDSVFDKVLVKLYYMSLRSVVDIDYSAKAAEIGFGSEKTANAIVNAWRLLNTLSWNARYDDNEKFKARKTKFNGPKSISTIQCLKYLECIRYQIELCTIEDKTPALLLPELVTMHQFLRPLINDLQRAIIGSMTEYKEALWSQG